MKMTTEEHFKNAKVYVWKEVFAILKSKNTVPHAFANIIDKNEITVIIEQSLIQAQGIIEIIDIEKDWKILTFDMVLPFWLVGFLAKISQVLADANISIFTISAYSTDHILVKEKDIQKTREVLTC